MTLCDYFATNLFPLGKEKKGCYASQINDSINTGVEGRTWESKDVEGGECSWDYAVDPVLSVYVGCRSRMLRGFGRIAEGFVLMVLSEDDGKEDRRGMEHEQSIYGLYCAVKAGFGG